MSDTRQTGLRGSLDAVGFLIDVPTIGEQEARDRVLKRWNGGGALRQLDDGRWLLTLSGPETLRAEEAPGIPITLVGGALNAAGAPTHRQQGEVLRERRHGQSLEYHLAALEVVDPSAWIDLSTHQLHRLEPLDATVPEPPQLTPAARVAEPDLRDAAKVARRSDAVRKLLGEDATAGNRNQSNGASAKRGDLLARLVLRSPAAGMVGRRHAKYLQKLTRSFESGDFENALRDAIRLGGVNDGGQGWLSLRLPARRTGRLTPSQQRTASGSVPYGHSAQTHLSGLYRRAAEQLERDGEIERAAFVLADLLETPRDAVGLLERHRMLDLAARLAEARKLDPDLVVRLWWLAGDRARAVEVARARGAWAAALQRLEEVDQSAAVELRSAWVASLRAAGDHLGAIDAAWPSAQLRDDIGADLIAARALGGVRAARALGMQLAWRPDPELAVQALQMVDDVDPAQVVDRLALLDTLAKHPAADAMTDRRLASQGVRALLRDGAAGYARAIITGRPTFKALRDRSDPLLKIDLPPFTPRQAETDVPLLHAAPEAGALPLSDAVAVSDGILVAAGERGVLLFARDGRTKAHWNVPATRLVLADHGATAIVAHGGEQVAELHRVDLTSRKLNRWTALPNISLLDSYDGEVLTLVTRAGIAGIDASSPQPRTLWSELDAESYVLDIARTPDQMSAIVNVPLQASTTERSVERWVWDLPSRRLRSRDVRSEEWAEQSPQVTADGTVVWLTQDDGGAWQEHQLSGDRRHQAHPLHDEFDGLVISGRSTAVRTRREDELRLLLRAPGTVDTVAVAAFAHAEMLGFRVHDDVATVFSNDGRVLVVDLVGRTCVATLSCIA